ncbi:MAG TPA: hypothetical protein VJ813_03460 [Vicinamibacterales bacterium]|nr:hypothetical protein [Vicinamibacterales bacterium]
MHASSTRFPQAVAFAVFLAVLGLLAGVRVGAEGALLFRIFLKDGGTLVSYGEFARVGDRVVFSVPLGDALAEPRVQVLTINEGLVDWTRTDSYTTAVRAKHYAETRGEEDFAMLTGQVTLALNDIALTADPTRRLAMAEEARRNLAAWPSANYGFKAADVAQLVSIFDDVIAEMKVEAGQGQFDLSLVAMTEPPPPVELLPAPDVQSSFEIAYRSALLAAEPAERTALLRTLSESLAYAPRTATWAAALRRQIDEGLASELKTDKAYGALSASMLKSAAALSARADVQGLQGLIARALRADEALGRKRAGEVAALLAALDLKLDEARKLRLARDAWALRTAAIREYRERISAPLERLAQFRKWLESIRDLAGPEPKFLRPLDDRARLAHLELMAVSPPAEAQAAQGLLSAALHMTRQAATLRRNAVSSNDIKIAWDASAAASGALTLGERAVHELDRLISSLPSR